MTRSCDRCARQYEAKRASSRFCRPACRVAASNARKAGLPESVAPVIEIPSHQSFSGQLSDAVARELSHAGQLDSALGQAVLALARRVDSNLDSGSSLAALVREVRASLAEALKDAPRASTALDDLASRRRAKAAGR